MRFSPDADAHSLHYKKTSHPVHVLETVVLLALLLGGAAIAYIVVRYVDHPKANVITTPQKTGSASAPGRMVGLRTGALPA